MKSRIWNNSPTIVKHSMAEHVVQPIQIASISKSSSDLLLVAMLMPLLVSRCSGVEESVMFDARSGDMKKLTMDAQSNGIRYLSSSWAIGDTWFNRFSADTWLSTTLNWQRFVSIAPGHLLKQCPNDFHFKHLIFGCTCSPFFSELAFVVFTLELNMRH